MKKIEIAVIDSGVEKDLLRNSIKNDIVIDKDGLSYANSNSSTYSWHGTNCALIIEKYCIHHQRNNSNRLKFVLEMG